MLTLNILFLFSLARKKKQQQKERKKKRLYHSYTARY